MPVIAFIINTDGTWLQVGTPEADDVLVQGGRTATVAAAVERHGFVAIEYGRTGVRVTLNPASVAALAIASLRPRLAVIEMPVDMIFPAVGLASERAATGEFAMRRIEALVKRYRDVALDQFGTSLTIAGRHPVSATAVGPGSYVVTADGTWFGETDQRLLEDIGFDDPNVDAIGYAVRNMGYIKVSLVDPGTTTIVLHPRNVELSAVKSLIQRIGQMTMRRFELRWLEDEWITETFTTSAAAVAKLRELCGAASEAPPRDRWHITTVSPSALSQTGSDALRLMHQKWRISFGNFDESVFSFAMRHGLLGRIILVGARKANDDLVFRYIGDDFGTYLTEEFRFRAIGNSVMDQPDKDYGAWVNAAYKAVVLAGTPRIDYIDAHLPLSKRGPWIRYERLLLPWRLPNGEILISMSSRIKADQLITPPEV